MMPDHMLCQTINYQLFPPSGYAPGSVLPIPQRFAGLGGQYRI